MVFNLECAEITTDEDVFRLQITTDSSTEHAVVNIMDCDVNVTVMKRAMV